MDLSGKVIINILDANTMEVIDTVEQNNVITKYMYGLIATGTGFGSTIYLSPSTNQSYEDWPLVPDCITNGYVPSGVTSPLSFPAAGANPAYVQIMMRFDAPAVTRSINTVGIPGGAGSVTHSGKLQYSMSAYVSLSAPCVQTTTQIMDVYYRIQASESTNRTYNTFNIPASRFLSQMFYNPYYNTTSSNGYIPIYGNLSSDSTSNPIASGSLFATFMTDSLSSSKNYTISNNTGGAGNSTIEASTWYSWSQTTSQGVGILYGAMTTTQYGNGYKGLGVNAAHNIVTPNGSKVQPIFSHAGSTLTMTSSSPFLDVIPSPGSGIASIEGDWTTGNLPELYKISIVDGGAVGTATYTFEKRNHFGFLSDKFNTNTAMLPGAFSAHTPGNSPTNLMQTVTFSKPHTSDVNHPNLCPGAYGQRMERYDNTHFISYDKTGVSRYNCANHFVELWDSTTTPALAATNLRQACVNNSDGSIWAACADTGVYRISADGLTVTKFTTANGLPSNICRAIDMGRNNTVWVYTDSGLATTIDSGVTWTTYNTGTTPAFNSPTLTAEPAAVWYMRVDPTHIDDRICIVRSADATTNYAIGMVWWNRATGVVTTSNGPTLTNITGRYRRNPCMFNVSDNDSIWALYNSTYCYIIGYNYASPITITTGTDCLQSVMFVRNATNTNDLILTYTAIYDSSMNGGTGSVYPIYSTYYDYNNRINTVLIDKTGAIISNITSGKNTGAKTIIGGFEGDTTCGVYLGGGVIAGYKYLNNYTYWQGNFGWITSICGDGTPLGGVMEYLIWDKYGWDGSNWVLGNTNAKTTHANNQPLIHGLTSKFTNGAVGTSFFATDYYTGSVNDGILKNNAMTVSSWVMSYYIPTEKLTDFDGVIRLYPWTTGLVSWRKASASITKNANGSLTNNIPYRSNSLNAFSKQRVFGDFSISGTLTTTTGPRYTIGIKSDSITEYAYNRETQYSTWSFYVYNSVIYILNSVGTTVFTLSNATGTPTWNITRVGNTITFYINGTSRYTTTDASYSFGVNARFVDTSTGTNAFTINPITIDSSGSGYYVGMGNSTTGNGIYDNKQVKHTIINTSDLSINGTPLTVCNNTTATPPASGGVSYSPEEGILLCHSSDAGKAITGSYIVNYQVSTPCNVPPV